MTLGPNFLVVGAAKSGTTSLCHYLRQHPDVFVARDKESHFFLYEGRRPDFTGPGDVEEFTPLIIDNQERYERSFANAGRATARGEASVYYLCRPEAISRALAYDPAMKFVAILRDPVERAFSAYSHMVRDGRETARSFGEALELEKEREAAGWSFGFQYEAVGRYGEQFSALQGVVPAGQMHVMLYEDLVADPNGTMSALFDFLGVPAHTVEPSVVMNASGKPRLRTLNNLLTQRNPLKEGLKRVIPYRLGTSMAHRLRNWNLESLQMSDEDAATLRARYRDDTALLKRVLGEQAGARVPQW